MKSAPLDEWTIWICSIAAILNLLSWSCLIISVYEAYEASLYASKIASPLYQITAIKNNRTITSTREKTTFPVALSLKILSRSPKSRSDNENPTFGSILFSFKDIYNTEVLHTASVDGSYVLPRRSIACNGCTAGPTA
ncbi:hypothetical protein CJ20_072 [Escherichia phage CJ20]|nr:hypothetical protein CJ20_072 [Escherichia phage CJ20]